MPDRHDRQPYPTAAAYDAVCAARTKWLDRADAAVALAEALRKIIQQAVDADVFAEWFTDTEHDGVDVAAALAMTDAGALEALRERVRSEVAEQIENYAEEIMRKAKAIPMGARSGRRSFLADCPAFDVEHFRADELVACAVFVRALAGGRKGDGNG